MTAMDWLTDGPAGAKITVVLAQGAGAPMDTPFMKEMARGLAASGLRVVRFVFRYMALRRTTGKRRGPDRPAVLHETWHAVIAALGDPAKLVIGGKSMGGRIASEVAEAARAGGVACLGYPFHPPGRPDKLRTAHLAPAALTRPMLIAQGERDSFGTPADVRGYDLSPSIEIVWLPDGDHSFKPRKSSGHTLAANMAAAMEAVAAFATRAVGISKS